MVYHTIVRSIARQNFERVNDKEYSAVLKDCKPDIHHRFAGNHALGGERHDRDALEKWFYRLGRLAPGLRLTVTDVWVKGWPWNTAVIMRWKATADREPDGSEYHNRGVHIIKMKWGKVIDIDANEDSQAVAKHLELAKGNGVEEAGAAPILS